MPFVVVSKLGSANDAVAVVSMTSCLRSGAEEAEFLMRYNIPYLLVVLKQH